MNYKNNHFYIENVSTEKIAKKYGTPVYSYSLKKIKILANLFHKMK